LRSPDANTDGRTPLRPLLAKEIREIADGRALWTMLLLVCPLVGYSFVQAVSLYGEASTAALASPALAVSLSPLDGVLVPTFGAFYVAVTLLFPFVAIRALGGEKESGALRLLVQLPYRSATLVAIKLAAVVVALLLAAVPALSALAIWALLGGHLGAAETLNLLLGHLLYGLLVGSIALFAAAVCESAATAAIVALAFTIGSWVLDFTVAGNPGPLGWLSSLSLTQTLRSFEQGLLSIGLVAGIAVASLGFVALAAIFLPPGVTLRAKLLRAAVCAAIAAAALAAATRAGTSIDVTEDRRNSFPLADQQALAQLAAPLVIDVHLSPEDPRYADLQRNVLAKLQRAMPDVTIRLAAGRQAVAAATGDDSYGLIEYAYGSQRATSRSTSHREALPVIYGLAGVTPPAPIFAADYPGYPLVVRADAVLAWFLAGLPLLIILAWWWMRRPPPLSRFQPQPGGQP
jgi:ABC-2 type transport system permease protein